MDYFKELDTFNEVNTHLNENPSSYMEAIRVISEDLISLEHHIVRKLTDIRKALTFIEMRYIKDISSRPIRLNEDNDD